MTTRDKYAKAHAWLSENGHVPTLRSLAKAQTLESIAEVAHGIVAREAPELADGAPWMEIAASIAGDEEVVTLVTDARNGIVQHGLDQVPEGARLMDSDSFISEVEGALKSGRMIAATFAADDQRLNWLKGEFGINDESR